MGRVVLGVQRKTPKKGLKFVMRGTKGKCGLRLPGGCWIYEYTKLPGETEYPYFNIKNLYTNSFIKNLFTKFFM